MSLNELNATLMPHSIIHGDACFAYFRKIRGIPCDGRVVGIPALRSYWGKALATVTQLKFELLKVLVGHACLTILYLNHRNQQAAETFEFANDGKVVRSFACYCNRAAGGSASS